MQGRSMNRVGQYWDFVLSASMATAVLVSFGYLIATSDSAVRGTKRPYANSTIADVAPTPTEGRSAAVNR